MAQTLAELARRHGTDKLDHGYLDFYEELFGPWRDRPLRVLEIGVGGFERPRDPAFGGASLRVWRDYFERAEIVGLDLLDKHGVAGERITVVQGSQTDPALLAAVAGQHGPFDIVIDDGSHVPAHVRATFALLVDALAPEAVYVVEDVQTSYWPRWGGSFRLGSSRTTMGLVKQRLDGLNHVEFERPDYRPTELDLRIVEVRARHNIVAFRFGDNTAASTMNDRHPIAWSSWVGHDVMPLVVERVRSPRTLAALDALGLRAAAGRLRRATTGRPDRGRAAR
jgi:hypothetical protein